MSTISEENSIFDFEVSDNEIDMAKLVPKLKDASNWRKWDAQMFIILGFNNHIYPCAAD